MAPVNKQIRGLRAQDELHQAHTHRDARSSAARLIEHLHKPAVMSSVLFLIAGVAFFFPAVSGYLFLVALALMWWGLTRPEHMPLKMPVQAGVVDTRTRKKAAGIFILGNERESGKEIWLTNDDCRQHVLVLGTTGAGKTEGLLGFVANALTWSSGALFVDGKGDVALFSKITALARRFGREDDLLVLNFMTGNKDFAKSGGVLSTNTLNPFSNGSSDGLTEMVVSLMDDAGGDGAMWKGRAQAMFTGVMRALVWLRDEDVVDLNVGTIRDFLNLRAIIDLGDPKKYPDMPQSIRTAVRSYLGSLPGYVEEKGHKQAQTTLDQHGYLEMQFTRILGSLADVYGHIFFTEAGEVDMHDVVLNRRILVVMLPALEKSANSIANLGKIVVANLKGMMGSTLGSVIQGQWSEVVDNRPTNSPSPFMVILDEVGYYAVEGLDLMAAQARSLGFSMVYAAQDLPGMKRLNEKVIGSVIGNTNTKIIQRIEDPETAEMALKLAGKGTMTRTGGFSAQPGEVNMTWRDNMDAQLTEVDRLNARDLRSQEAGETVVIHQDEVIYARMFYANPEESLDKYELELGTNHFIKVPKPTLSDIEQEDRIPEVLERIVDPEFGRRMAEAARKAEAGIEAAAAKKDELAVAIAGFNGYRERNRGVAVTQAACASAANVVRAIGGLGDALSQQMRTAASAPREMADAMLDDPFAGGGSAPPSSRFFDEGDDMAPPPLDLLSDDDDDLPPPLGEDEDDDLDMGPETARPERRKATIQPFDHQVHIGERRVEDRSQDITENDAVVRMLADLDYDAERTTTEEIDSRLQESMGSQADVDYDDLASAETIDHVVVESEKVRDSQPLMPAGQEEFLTEIFDTLMDDPTEEGE